MQRTTRWLIGLTVVVSATPVTLVSAYDDYGRSGYGTQYQSSQTYYNQPSRQQSQYPYQPSYNGDSNYSYRQQSNYGGQQYGYGSQQYGYGQREFGYGQQQSPGFPGEQRSDGAQGSRADSGEDQPRRHKRRKRRSADYDSESGGRMRRGRVSTTLGNNDWSGGAYAGYGQIAVCVRSCDGYFFPMGLVTDNNSLDAQRSLCTALCPDAKTELFFQPQGADGIATAISESGHPYSTMPNALRYTKKRVEACTCHGRTPQARLVALTKDFTLRRNDAVMTVNGVLVFKGAWRWPYQLADFQVLDKAKYYLSNALALAALEKAALHVQQAAKAAPKKEKTAAQAPDTFITDTAGKTVRLVGEALSYAPAGTSPGILGVPEARSEVKTR